MRIGDLNRRVRIERRLTADDDQGGQTLAAEWVELRTVWAKGAPIAGKEGVVNGTLRSTQPWRIEMRPTDVTVKDRLVLCDGTVLGIQSCADPDGRRATIVLFCASEPA